MGSGMGSTNLRLVDIVKKVRVLISTFDVSFTRIPEKMQHRSRSTSKSFASVLEMKFFSGSSLDCNNGFYFDIEGVHYLIEPSFSCLVLPPL